MTKDVYVFGDSHWRVFFPFVNHGAATDNVSHEQDGIRTIDTIANELSGATMWGLLNSKSRIGARQRILSTIDSLGGVDNVGLTFGEVDVRYHHGRYFVGDKLSYGRLHELVGRYRAFVEEDLLFTGRVRGRVFIYYGYTYPKRADTLLQPGQPIGEDGWRKATILHGEMRDVMHDVFIGQHAVTFVRPWGGIPGYTEVSDDGVHLLPEKVYPAVLDDMKYALYPRDRAFPL